MADSRPRRPAARGGRVVDVALWAAAAALLGLTALRLSGVDGVLLTVALLALTPVTAVAGLVLALLAGVLRRPLVAVVAAVLTVVLVVVVLPRVVPEQTEVSPSAARLRVLAFNAYVGAADAEQLVAAVRERRVDVLVLLELTPQFVARLDAAGWRELLPEQHLLPAAGDASGSGIAARYPLADRAALPGSTFAQPSASVPDVGVEVQAVHPVPPVGGVRTWARELRQLPDAPREGPIRILAGDFNATLDHAAYRAVLDRGYVDAADERGAGLVPTWERAGVPLLTLDHVAVDPRLRVVDVDVLDVAGSDHRAVYAELALPLAPGAS